MARKIVSNGGSSQAFVAGDVEKTSQANIGSLVGPVRGESIIWNTYLYQGLPTKTPPEQVDQWCHEVL